MRGGGGGGGVEGGSLADACGVRSMNYWMN